MTLLLLLPLPILSLQILYLNLLVDIGPAIALAYEPAEEDVMKQPPRKKDEGLANKKSIRTKLGFVLMLFRRRFSYYAVGTKFSCSTKYLVTPFPAVIPVSIAPSMYPAHPFAKSDPAKKIPSSGSRTA